MPHALFLSSQLATVVRIDKLGINDQKEDAEFTPPSLACVDGHMMHATVDIVGSLLGFALVCNSCILIAVSFFFYSRFSLVA